MPRRCMNAKDTCILTLYNILILLKRVIVKRAKQMFYIKRSNLLNSV